MLLGAVLLLPANSGPPSRSACCCCPTKLRSLQRSCEVAAVVVVVLSSVRCLGPRKSRYSALMMRGPARQPRQRTRAVAWLLAG